MYDLSRLESKHWVRGGQVHTFCAKKLRKVGLLEATQDYEVTSKD